MNSSCKSCTCAQSRLILWDPMDCSPQGSFIHGILQAQEYWSGLPFPPPGDLPESGIEPTSPMSPALQADSLPLGHLGSPQDDLKHNWKLEVRKPQCCLEWLGCTTMSPSTWRPRVRKASLGRFLGDAILDLLCLFSEEPPFSSRAPTPCFLHKPSHTALPFQTLLRTFLKYSLVSTGWFELKAKGLKPSETSLILQPWNCNSTM